MTSPNLLDHAPNSDLAAEALQELYARRSIVDNLIRSLEEYERSSQVPARRKRGPSRLPAARETRRCA
jgi:hypothetical protein